MSAAVEKVETQLWYLRKDGTIGTYTGNWCSPPMEGKNGRYQKFHCKDSGEFRSFTLSRILKVKENGKQVYPEPRKMVRATNGRFVRA